MTVVDPTFAGVHHVAVPVTDIERSRDWYEAVLGFRSVVDEETEDSLVAVTLEHPTGGIVVCLSAAPERAHALAGFSPVSLAVASVSELARWENHFTTIGVQHSASREAHLGWALDVTDPDGIRIQLHTREGVSADVD
jgi:catechol 2,3-dioxygenase-like lactoylglutathione lyase family enzyme